MFAAAKDLLSELDRHCFYRALSSAHGLPRDTKLFIDILPSSMCDPSLLEMVEEQAGGGERIVLEISERQAVQDYARFLEATRSFTDRGFEVAVDNIGAG